MSDEYAKKVQAVIKQYVDDVGDEIVDARTLDKIINIYKDFIKYADDQVKPIMKKNTKVKEEIAKLKKGKEAKGADKQEKITFNKSVSEYRVRLFKQEKVLDDVVLAYRKVEQRIREIKRWNTYEQWFDWALDFSEGSYLATHIAKLTHSSSKGSSIDIRYYNSCNKYNSQYLSTSETQYLDTAYPDNKYSSISQLYSLDVDGRYIGDLLSENNDKYLQVFTKNNELLKSWCQCFSKNIKNDNKQSYFLSKQTYFPVGNYQYHLLLPLTSSSLLHKIHFEHKRCWDNNEKLDIVQRAAKKQKKAKKYSATITCTYPNKAYLHVTGSNHSNASSLNGKRGGRIALLPTMPPQWQSKIPSYFDKEAIFDKTLGYELKNDINELRKYLGLIKTKSLSISEPKRNAAVITKLQQISNKFFSYVGMINNNEPAGWSVDSRLPIELQVLFEPWREDEAAIAMKKNNQWQSTISRNYGRWLNKQLNKKNKLLLKPIHEALWRDAFLMELREYIAVQEVIV